MANKLKTKHNNVKILYESFKPDTGVFIVSISWWEKTPDDYDNYYELKDKILHTKWFTSNTTFYPLTLIVATTEFKQGAMYQRKVQEIDAMFQEYQLVMRLRNVELHKSNLRTFEKNLQPVRMEVEKFVDYLFELPYAPVPYSSKKMCLAAAT